MAKVKEVDEAHDSVHNPDLGKITTVEEAAKMFGPEFIANLATMLAPQLQRLAQGNVRKVYEIEPYTGTHEIVEHIRQPMIDQDGAVVVNDKGQKRYNFVEHKRMVSGGWMVYLPQGHSIYVESQEQLNRLKLDSPTGLVDMNTGFNLTDEVESIKSRVSRNTQHTPPSRRSGDGSLAGSIDVVLRTVE